MMTIIIQGGSSQVYIHVDRNSYSGFNIKIIPQNINTTGTKHCSFDFKSAENIVRNFSPLLVASGVVTVM